MTQQAPVQQPTKPQGEDDWIRLSITNKLTEPLNLYSATLTWGKWCDGQSPTPVIPAKTQNVRSFYACGRMWSPSGAEGEVTYYIGSNQTMQVKIYFDVPYSGPSSARVTSTDPNVQLSLLNFNPDSHQENCTLVVEPMSEY